MRPPTLPPPLWLFLIALILLPRNLDAQTEAEGGTYQMVLQNKLDPRQRVTIRPGDRVRLNKESDGRLRTAMARVIRIEENGLVVRQRKSLATTSVDFREAPRIEYVRRGINLARNIVLIATLVIFGAGTIGAILFGLSTTLGSGLGAMILFLLTLGLTAFLGGIGLTIGSFRFRRLRLKEWNFRRVRQLRTIRKQAPGP